jgi:hypothetical protein
MEVTAVERNGSAPSALPSGDAGRSCAASFSGCYLACQNASVTIPARTFTC